MHAVNLRRIIVPTDFSDTADYAFAAAEQLAARFRAEIGVVHCEPGEAVEAYYSADTYALAQSREIDLLERLEQYADERLAGCHVPYGVRLMHDGPVSGVSRVAQELDVDLIVIGTHGRTGWRRAVLGSVSEGIIATANRPVLTVRGETPAPIERILCPVDFSVESAEALNYAASLALTLDALLLVVHVTPEGAQERDHPDFREWIPAEVRAHCRYADYVERGEVAAEILAFAERHEASLIVVGRRHKPGIERALGRSTSLYLARHATCPVLTVVAPAAQRENVRREEPAASAPLPGASR